MSHVKLRLVVRRPRPVPAPKPLRPRRRPRLSPGNRRRLQVFLRRSGERVYFTVLTRAAGLLFLAILRRCGAPKEPSNE